MRDAVGERAVEVDALEQAAISTPEDTSMATLEEMECVMRGAAARVVR